MIAAFVSGINCLHTNQHAGILVSAPDNHGSVNLQLLLLAKILLHKPVCLVSIQFFGFLVIRNQPISRSFLIFWQETAESPLVFRDQPFCFGPAIFFSSRLRPCFLCQRLKGVPEFQKCRISFTWLAFGCCEFTLVNWPC